MRSLLNIKTESLSIQSLLLIIGRVFVLPISFFIPIVLVRCFSVEEFGQYKQLFMVFLIILPVVDFGITQGLVYFVPKYSDIKGKVLSHLLNCQLLLGAAILALFFGFNEEIANFFTGSNEIAQLLPYIGILLVVWSLSNNLEVLLTAEKKTPYAAVFTFFSESGRGLSIMLFAYLIGEVRAVIVGVILVGCVRCLLLVTYLVRKRYLALFQFDREVLADLLNYSVPLGFAVLVNALIDYTHQIIVSNQVSAADFAIYSIGCFQVPFLGIFSNAISRVATVRICELHQERNLRDIGGIIANSIRKLALIFFPVFVLLWSAAPDLIRLLYTDAYIGGLPIFRMFILVLPASALLVEYIPRALGDARFVFKVNCATLLLNVLMVLAFISVFGIIGAAAGFVLSRIIRKVIILRYIRSSLQVSWSYLIPFRSLARIAFCSLSAGLPGLVVQNLVEMRPVYMVLCQFSLFVILLPGFLWFAGGLSADEKSRGVRFLQLLADKFRQAWNPRQAR